ncbi:MAG TPA: LuxR C-terminal-related transcriptional regulator [Planctomycetota bacterium]
MPELLVPDLPPWIHALALPLWVIDPAGRLIHVNQLGEDLLGATAHELHGRECRLVVGAIDACGHAICTQDCVVRRSADSGQPLASRRAQLRGGHGPGETAGRWIELVTIPLELTPGAGAYLVEFALDADRAVQADRYLRAVAARSPGPRAGDPDAAPRPLTPRECQILLLLAQDLDQHAVAHRLHVSYATVRNHVAHLLPKLGVHSIPEAVALHLLGESS